MNFCTKCSSYYAKPGTCNCYATAVGTGPSDRTDGPWVYPTNPPYPVRTSDWQGEQPPTITSTEVKVSYQNGDGTSGGNLTVLREDLEELRKRGGISYTGNRA